MTFAALLRRHRRTAGLTQADLAGRAGISERAVSDLERGVGRVPRRDTVEMLAGALALTDEERAAFDTVVQRARTQALAGDVRTDPAPSKPIQILPTTPPTAQRRHNLPASLSSFIGRAHEQQQVRALVLSDRLVTLRGPGGCGKTRLALAVATGVTAEYPDGVWLVELAPLADARLVPEAIARVLHVPEAPGRPLLETLTEYLRDRQILLLLDNCEHVVEACAELVTALLRASQSLRVLATSRESLRVAGERLFLVPSLSVPEPGHLPTPELVGAYEAVRLFVRRARERTVDFALTPTNAAAIATLCARLDGMPLAIELAAARMESAGVEVLASRLGDRFELLTAGSRDLPARQRTLRATLDWSWELLTAAERTALSQLSVFADGCDLAAAEAVCAGDGLEGRVLDLLDGLVNKSFVQVDRRKEGAPRYRLLETIHQYAAERLAERDAGAATRDRHLAHFLALAEEARDALQESTQAAWLDRLEREHANLRAALGWARDSGARAAQLQLAGALGRFWSLRGHAAEGCRWLEEALGASEGASAHRARALSAAGELAYWLGNYPRAMALYEQALALRHALDDRQGVAAELAHLGSIRENQGDFAGATTYLEESLALYRAMGDAWTISSALSSLGWLLVCMAEYERASGVLEEALAHKRALGDRLGISYVLNQLALVAAQQGEYDRALALQEECLTLRRELGDKYGLADVLNNMGRVAFWQQDYQRAVDLFGESLRLTHTIGIRIGMMISIEWLGRSAAATGHVRRAAVLLGSAQALRQVLGVQIPPAESGSHDHTVAAVRGAIGDAAFAAAWAEGQALPLEEAIVLALDDTGAARAIASTSRSASPAT
jgi:non-specific serine/threonine protein kinase